MLKSLIVYYSLEGNVELLTKYTANLLGSDVMELVPVKPYPTGRISKYISGRAAMAHETPELRDYTLDPDDYDVIIIGTPVWASNPAPPVNTFMMTTDLSEKRVALIVSSKSGNGEKCIAQMEKMLGRKADVVFNVKEPKEADQNQLVEETAAFARDVIGPYDTGEEWELYDADENKEDIKMHRGQPIPDGHYHKIVSVWIKNSEGKFLISKRSAQKIVSPSTWECTGGAVDTGESTLDAAVREVKEELGIDLDPETGKLVRQTRHDDMHEFYDVWLFEKDVDIEDLKLQEEEVADVRWMTKEDVEELWEKNEFNVLLYYYDEIM